MKIPEFKRSGIGIIAESRGILRGFPNQVRLSSPVSLLVLGPELLRSTNRLDPLRKDIASPSKEEAAAAARIFNEKLPRQMYLPPASKGGCWSSPTDG
jgi:hypothetical protein